MPTAEQYFAAMDAEAARFAAARALVCPPDGCEYVARIGTAPGADVDIDGGIYPDSPYAAHIEGCAAQGWPRRAAPEAPWDRADGCFGHCDPEGWHAPCRNPVTDDSQVRR